MHIDDIGMNGEGIAHENNKAVFVPFYLPGEEIVEGELIKRSEYRIEPICKYYKECGGCDLQHLEYNQSLEFKTQKIKNILKKFKIDCEVLSCYPSEKIFYYRNKITLKCENGILGFLRYNSHDIIQINECKIASKEINLVVNALTKINKNNFKEVIIQNSEKKVIITIKLSSKNYAFIKELEKEIKKIFVDFSIKVYFNEKLIFSLGENYFLKKEFNIVYPFTNNSFYQINDEVKNIVYQQILNFIDGGEEVVDAYSGSGLLSAIISKKAKHVTGIEINKISTNNAEKLKKENKLDNLTNINGDSAVELNKLNFDICVLDPPRAGVNKKVIKSLLDKKPKKIIYLSCNPATLARDLSLLISNYKITYIRPFDMFPQTHHVETLVCLTNIK